MTVSSATQPSSMMATTATTPSSYLEPLKQQPASSSSSSNTAAHGTPDASEIVDYFIYNYYNMMTKEPEKLHLFYGETSTMTLGFEGEKMTKECRGQQDIAEMIHSLSLKSSFIAITSLDFQTSIDDSILVFIVGEMVKADSNGAMARFAQIFLLAPQTQGYFVLNDCFRFLTKPTIHTTTTLGPSLVEEHHHATPPSPSSASASEHHVEPTTPLPLVSEPITPSQTTASVASQHPVVALAAPLPESAPLPQVSATTIPAIKKVPETKGGSSWARLAAAQTDKWVSTEVSKPTTAQTIVPLEEPQSHPTTTTKKPATMSLAPTATTAAAAAAAVAVAVAATAAVATAPTPASTPAKSQPSKTLSAALLSKSSPSSDALSNSKFSLGQGNADPELSVFIKGIRRPISAETLRPHLETFGPVSYIDIVPEKTCAFVNYKTPIGAQAAMNQVIRVDDMDLVIEARKFKNGFKEVHHRSSRRRPKDQ